MALPTAYLTSLKNLADILEAMKSAQAPKKFSQPFLEGLGFKSTADRLVVGVLKSLGFLTPSGEPAKRYFEFLDQTQSAKILGEAIQEAYADLYQFNTRAHELSNSDLINKMKTLTQGQVSESVLEKMAGTFKALSSLADFSIRPHAITRKPEAAPAVNEGEQKSVDAQDHRLRLGGLVYKIELHLPESRDPAVYDILFKSLKEHLLR